MCAAAYRSRVACFDAVSGRQLWARDVIALSGVTLDERYAFVTDERGAVHALDRANGQSVWKQDGLAYRQVSTPLARGEAVVVGDFEGYVHFLARESGAFLARAGDRRRRAARHAGAAARQRAGADRRGRAVCARAVKPVIALVGRPNVGKSTLFNRLTRSRDAIVHDVPGVTRDRHYGEGRLGSRPFIAIDTGGFEPRSPQGVFVEMARQAEQAIVEADAVVFVVDGRAGLTPGDRAIADRLRRRKHVYVAVNKSEGLQPDTAVAEFHELGLGEPAAISAAHGEGVRELLDLVLSTFPEEESADEKAEANHPRIAVVGRPNVGKSTLVNALVGEERVIAFDQPGTTRDPIEVPFQRGGRRYTLIDTAGLRRRGKTGEPVEYFSIVKALQSIEESNVAILLLDASTGITEQDAHVAGYVLERGRAMVLAVNKWDAADKEARERMKAELAWKLGFLGFARDAFHLGRGRARAWAR